MNKPIRVDAPIMIKSMPMNLPNTLKKNMIISPMVSKKLLEPLFTLLPTFS